MAASLLFTWNVQNGVTFLLAVALLYVAVIFSARRSLRRNHGCPMLKSPVSSNVQLMPSPKRLPFIGHLHLLQGNPFVDMTALAATHGEIYFLQLGTVDTVVVSSFRLIKQVLVEQGADFGNRINYRRYNVLFGDDKENSLAFCNWSQVQKTRRSLARRFCHSSVLADRADESQSKASSWLSQQIIENHSKWLNIENGPKELKGILHKACANAFFDYFCSDMFEDPKDQEFDTVVRLFDDIFYEINQGHVTDVLPILSPFYRSHLKQLGTMGKTIRDFVLKRIIEPHMEKLDLDNPIDFVDILLVHLKEGDEESRLTMDQVLYELEDFIGGHAAVANLLVRALIEIAGVPGLSEKIYQRCINGEDAPYMKALIYETLRKSSSPIVPHVASVDTELDGYPIQEGTMIILNNYELNTSHKLWTNPEAFIPERFLSETGAFRKPAHFLPFSTGKRACMGYKMVEKFTEGLILAIVKDFNIEALENPNVLTQSCIAVHPDTDIRIKFMLRANQ